MKTYLPFLITVMVLILFRPAFGQGKNKNDMKNQSITAFCQSYFFKDSKVLMIYEDDITISAGKNVQGDVLVLNGNLTIDGSITGKAVVVKGDLIINETGAVGSAVVVQGKTTVRNTNQDVSQLDFMAWDDFKNLMNLQMAMDQESKFSTKTAGDSDFDKTAIADDGLALLDENASASENGASGSEKTTGHSESSKTETVSEEDLRELERLNNLITEKENQQLKKSASDEGRKEKKRKGQNHQGRESVYLDGSLDLKELRAKQKEAIEKLKEKLEQHKENLEFQKELQEALQDELEGDLSRDQQEKLRKSIEKARKKMEKANKKMKTFNIQLDESPKTYIDFSDNDYELNLNLSDGINKDDLVIIDENGKVVVSGKKTPKKTSKKIFDASYFEIQTEPYKPVRAPYHYFYHEPYDNNYLLVVYNRVDGIYLGARMDKRNKMFTNKPFQLYGEVGYAFGLKQLHYQLGVDRYWGREFRFEIGGEFHDLTGTQDKWIIGDMENTLNAVLFKNDYRDYFRTLGYSAHVSQNINPFLKLTLQFNGDRYRSLEPNADWALFIKARDFRPNPAIDDGDLYSLTGKAEFNNVEVHKNGRYHLKRQGWMVSAEGERSMHEWNSDFRFSRYTFYATRYQPLSRWENIDTRVYIGSSVGDTPRQKLFSLGGLSTLRGHDYKAFTGNHFALVNVEYRLSSGRFHEDKIFFLNPFSLILFTDAGYAWYQRIDTYRSLYAGFDPGKIETDFGVGLGDERDMFRVDLAKNVNKNGGDLKVSFRINYAF